MELYFNSVIICIFLQLSAKSKQSYAYSYFQLRIINEVAYLNFYKHIENQVQITVIQCMTIRLNSKYT